MVVKLYGILPSPPVRASMFTLDALNIPYEFVEVDLLNKGQFSPEFLKLNPQHTVPVLVDDDGFVVNESHTINAYLANKYAKDDKLYPKDPKKRSMVDRRMYFDDGTLFAGIRKIMVALVWEKTETKVTEKMVASMENDCFAMLEKFLGESSYIAGNEMTIADFSIASTLSNINLIMPINKQKFPLMAAYMKRCNENIPKFEDVTSKAMKQYEKVLEHFDLKLAEIRASN